MKRLSLSVIFLFVFSILAIANNENVCVVTNQGASGQECSPSAYGERDPCSSALFVVNYTIPSGFIIVAKYEWYVISGLVCL